MREFSSQFLDNQMEIAVEGCTGIEGCTGRLEGQLGVCNSNKVFRVYITG